MNHLLNIAGQQNQQQLHNEIQVIEVSSMYNLPTKPDKCREPSSFH